MVEATAWKTALKGLRSEMKVLDGAGDAAPAIVISPEAVLPIGPVVPAPPRIPETLAEVSIALRLLGRRCAHPLERGAKNRIETLIGTCPSRHEALVWRRVLKSKRRQMRAAERAQKQAAEPPPAAPSQATPKKNTRVPPRVPETLPELEEAVALIGNCLKAELGKKRRRRLVALIGEYPPEGAAAPWKKHLKTLRNEQRAVAGIPKKRRPRAGSAAPPSHPEPPRIPEHPEEIADALRLLANRTRYTMGRQPRERLIELLGEFPSSVGAAVWKAAIEAKHPGIAPAAAPVLPPTAPAPARCGNGG